ncbi:MAG: outer membrane beta-barrel protein [Verrucomicrobiota bacterium]
MKALPNTLCLIAICSPLYAGEYTPGPAPAPAPMTTYESYNWFLGGGGEYLLDSEEDYWNAHFGYKFSEVSAIFLEVGWAGNETSERALHLDLDIVPITLNYKYTWAFSENFGWYFGVGAGAASVDISANDESKDEWGFTAQAFTGMVFEFSPSFEMYLGLRYIWIDDTEIFNREVETLDDVSVGLGLRFNF